MTERLPGWRGRLSSAIDAARKPFSWGAHDCCLGLACPAVLALTGKDLAEPFRGKYSSAAGAVYALKRAGYNDLCDLASANFEEIHPSEAQIGDIAAFRAGDTGWALGIVLGERVAVLAPEGFATKSRLEAERAFRV